MGLISHFLSPVSCDSLVLQGLGCEWWAAVLNLVLSLSLSHTGHWKFNMAPHGKELKDKDDVGYKKIAKTLKLSCSMVAKTIQRFNRTGSTQNRPRHGWPKKLSARALKGWGVRLSVLRPYAAHCIKLVCMAVVPRLHHLMIKKILSSIRHSFQKQSRVHTAAE